MNKFGDFVFKMRGAIWTALFAVIYVLAAPTWTSFWFGLVFVVLGQALRLWAVGCIKRYRGEKVGAQELVTTGAYAVTRNPLYVGNFLIGTGWGIMAGATALWVFIGAFIAVYVLVIIPREEDFLRGKFGIEYVAYCRRVGRFFPLGLPFKSDIFGAYDRTIIWKSERYSIWMTVMGTLLLAIK